MELTEKTLNEEYIYKGRIIKVRRDEVELPNGHKSMREVVEHSGGVCVLPLTDRDEVIFVRQFRYPYKEVILEIPAGKRDHGEESPLECGKRELAEETGAKADKYTSLGELYPSPGYCGEVIYMFLATGLTFGDTNPDEDEFLNVEKIPFDKALDMVLSDEIKDSKTQCALMKAAILLGKLRK
jgi:hydrolase, NUDIX family